MQPPPVSGAGGRVNNGIFGDECCLEVLRGRRLREEDEERRERKSEREERKERERENE